METKEIWDKYAEELRRFLMSKTADKDLADDILQEVFVKVHLKKSQLRSGKDLRPWLYRIASHCLTDFFRSKTYTPEITPASTDTSEEAKDHSAENCLLPLIEELPEIYRKALLLSEIENKKQQQVAEILGISVSGAKSRIQRGRKLLQEGYMNCCDYTLNENGLLVGEPKTEEQCKVCQ